MLHVCACVCLGVSLERVCCLLVLNLVFSTPSCDIPSVCVKRSVWLCACACAHVRTSVSDRECVREVLCAYATCVHVHVHVRVQMLVCVPVCINVCVYVCMRA